MMRGDPVARSRCAPMFRRTDRPGLGWAGGDGEPCARRLPVALTDEARHGDRLARPGRVLGPRGLACGLAADHVPAASQRIAHLSCSRARTGSTGTAGGDRRLGLGEAEERGQGLRLVHPDHADGVRRRDEAGGFRQRRLLRALMLRLPPSCVTGRARELASLAGVVGTIVAMVCLSGFAWSTIVAAGRAEQRTHAATAQVGPVRPCVRHARGRSGRGDDVRAGAGGRDGPRAAGRPRAAERRHRVPAHAPR